MTYLADTIEFVTRLSTDTLLLIFLIAGFAIATLYLGKDWIISFIFALFASTWFYSLVPFDLPQSTWYVFGSKIVIALVIAYILKRFIGSEFPYKNSKKYIQSVILGIVATISLMVVGLVEAYGFSGFISRWFVGDFQFWASLVPLVVLLFVIKK